MQRWMAAKMQLAKTHGTARSGAGRAFGDVWDDRPVERVEVKVHPIKPRKPNVVLKHASDRPVSWCNGRRARRAAQQRSDAND